MHWAQLPSFLLEPARPLCRNITQFPQGQREREFSRSGLSPAAQASVFAEAATPCWEGRAPETRSRKVGLDFMLIYVKNVAMES